MTLEFLAAPSNTPFTAALLLMCAVTALQIVSLITGNAISHAIDSCFPNFHTPHLHGHGIVDGIEGSGLAASFLGWLHLGKVPTLALLIIFLTSFGLTGIALEQIWIALFGALLPSFVAVLPALLVAIVAVHLLGFSVRTLLPSDESQAISNETFIGRVATIVTGTSKIGSPAEARFKDEHDQTHFVLTEPDNEGEQFAAGSLVLLVRRDGHRYRVIAGTNPGLILDTNSR